MARCIGTPRWVSVGRRHAGASSGIGAGSSGKRHTRKNSVVEPALDHPARALGRPGHAAPGRQPLTDARDALARTQKLQALRLLFVEAAVMDDEVLAPDARPRLPAGRGRPPARTLVVAGVRILPALPRGGAR